MKWKQVRQTSLYLSQDNETEISNLSWMKLEQVRQISLYLSSEAVWSGSALLVKDFLADN